MECFLFHKAKRRFRKVILPNIWSSQNESLSDHGYSKKRKQLVQNTKKLDCPAQICLNEVMFFQTFKVIMN